MQPPMMNSWTCSAICRPNCTIAKNVSTLSLAMSSWHFCQVSWWGIEEFQRPEEGFNRWNNSCMTWQPFFPWVLTQWSARMEACKPGCIDFGDKRFLTQLLRRLDCGPLSKGLTALSGTWSGTSRVIARPGTDLSVSTRRAAINSQILSIARIWGNVLLDRLLGLWTWWRSLSTSLPWWRDRSPCAATWWNHVFIKSSES